MLTLTADLTFFVNAQTILNTPSILPQLSPMTSLDTLLQDMVGMI